MFSIYFSHLWYALFSILNVDVTLSFKDAFDGDRGVDGGNRRGKGMGGQEGGESAVSMQNK